MTLRRFVEFLQQLITMTDPNKPEQVARAKAILQNLYELSKASGKADSLAVRAIDIALYNFANLLRFRDNFAGKPGDFAGNEAKRRRLENAVRPGC